MAPVKLQERSPSGTERTLPFGRTPARFLGALSLFNVISVFVVGLLAILALYPIARVVTRIFWVDGMLTAAPIRATLQQGDLVTLVTNTVIVVVSSSALALVIGAIFAWLNERTDARMGLITDTLPLVPFLLPPVAGAIGWVLLLAPRAGYANGVIRWMLEPFGVQLTQGPFTIFSWYGLIFVFTLYQVPYVFLMVVAGLRSLDPSLEEQSRISGASLPTTIRRVTLPALGPSLSGAILLMAWQGFALFSVPVIIGTPAGIDVLAVRVVRLLTFTWPPQTDIAIGLSAVIVLFVGVTWILQRRVLSAGRHATIAGKSHRASRISLGKWKWPTRALMFSYVLAAAVLPLVALLLVSLNGFWTLNIDWGNLSFGSFRRQVFGHPVTRQSLYNSVTISVVTATIGMIAAGIASLFLLRNKGILSRSMDGAIKLPAVISNVVVAVGFLLAFAGPPFRLGGTLLILGMAYLVLYLPQGLVATDAAAGQVGEELPEASRVSGAGKGRTLWKISMPLMLAGLAAGWALLFARMVGDLTASALLSGTGNPVVGFRILEIYNHGSFSALAALTVVLVAITFTVITIMFILQKRQMRWGIAPQTF